jgi:hypothetical protein
VFHLTDTGLHFVGSIRGSRLSGHTPPVMMRAFWRYAAQDQWLTPAPTRDSQTVHCGRRVTTLAAAPATVAHASAPLASTQAAQKATVDPATVIALLQQAYSLYKSPPVRDMSDLG